MLTFENFISFPYVWILSKTDVFEGVLRLII